MSAEKCIGTMLMVMSFSRMSEGIRVLTVKRTDLYPGFLKMYADNEDGQTLEFVEVNNTQIPDKWSSALLEYFNGRTSRLEMLEIVRQ